MTFAPLVTIPVAIAGAFARSPRIALTAGIRRNLKRYAPWLVRAVESLFKVRDLEDELREVADAIPSDPASLEFLDPVLAAIASAVGTSRVAVLWTSAGRMRVIRSFGYTSPPDYDFLESGSLAIALRAEVVSGRQLLTWNATSEERLKLAAMQTLFYNPLQIHGQLLGCFALGANASGAYSDAEKYLLTPMAERTAVALSRFFELAPGTA